MKKVSTTNIYALPVPPEEVTLIVKRSASHKGAFEGAIDLAIPTGTPVYASYEGMVTRVKDDSSEYGNDQKFGELVNYVTLEHANGEYSEYLHLDRASALVTVGEHVIRGQQLAVTGLSGWLSEPHLHWMVFRYITEQPGFQCMKIMVDTDLPAPVTNYD